MDRSIRTVEDVLALMDGLFAPDADRWTADGAPWWDGFYRDRDRDVPFFVAKPDSPYFGEPFLWTALFRRGSRRVG